MIGRTNGRDLLRIHAGGRILSQVREEGIVPSRIRVLAGTATGPRWCAWASIDDVLCRTDFSDARYGHVVLTGASAGAWRMAALACRNPFRAMARFRRAYVGMHFRIVETPSHRLRTLAGVVRRFLRDEDVPYLLDHPVFRLRVPVTRLRHLLASRSYSLSFAGFLAARISFTWTNKLEPLFWERVAFTTGASSPGDRDGFSAWRTVPLTRENLFPVLTATGAVPFKVRGVRHVPLAPKGTYCDGGLAEYTWNHTPRLRPDDLVLVVHHGGPLYPGWMDKKARSLQGRIPDLGQVVVVSPSPEYIASLPGGRLPDQDDWVRFAHAPEERIRMWQGAIERSRALGPVFEEALAGRALGKWVQPLGGREQGMG